MIRRRLRILGQALDLEIEEPETPATLFSVLAPARAVAATVAAVVRAKEAARGKTPTCTEGCSACCRHLVPISAIEAVHLARVVDAMPPAQKRAVRARFAETVKRLDRAGLVADDRVAMTVVPRDGESAWDAVTRRYRELGVPCPLLVGSRCSLYEERPLVCREYVVSSPKEECASARGDIDAFPRPVRMSEVLSDVGNAITGDAVPSIPLPLALEYADRARDAFERPVDAALLANTLAASIAVEI